MKKILDLILYKIGFERNENLKYSAMFSKLYEKYNGYTMIPEFYFHQNLSLCMKYKNIPGVVVECGAWKGGMAAAIADVIDTKKQFFLFDSFQGLPDAQEKDGESAKAWQANKFSANYFNNCTANELDAKKALSMSMASKNSTTVQGWFKDTLPKYNFNSGISILRLDGDWYDSTMDCLNNLFPQVNSGGLIILDDYYTWDGCAKAVHDYLSQNKCTERISTYNDSIYFMQKK